MLMATSVNTDSVAAEPHQTRFYGVPVYDYLAVVSFACQEWLPYPK